MKTRQTERPNPRESQLRKAALTLLAAATAAVFVCAPAGSIPIVKEIPGKKIQIDKMGAYFPLSSDTIEGEWHTVYVSTNMPFHRVNREEGWKHLILNLDVAYNGVASSGIVTRTLGLCADLDGDGKKEFHPLQLEDENFYRLLANTGLVNKEDEVDVEIDGKFTITWSKINQPGQMQRSDYREYVHDPNDPNRKFDPNAAWFNGSNYVGGEFGAFPVE